MIKRQKRNIAINRSVRELGNFRKLCNRIMLTLIEDAEYLKKFPEIEPRSKYSISLIITSAIMKEFAITGIIK